jgi:hypothetical protein
MHPQQVLDLDQRRVQRFQREVGIVVQRVDHRPQALGALHVPMAGLVVEHVGVGIERQGHGQAAFAVRAIRASPQAARAAITGSRLRPSAERLYSTFGGTWA